MPKSRKFRENRIDFPDPRPDPIREALIKAKRDVPFTELRKFLPRPKTILLYRQKNHGKYREPSIVILNQKIQGRSKKMKGMKRSFSEKYNKTMKRRVKKTRRNRSNKYKKGMMGGVNTPPRTPPRRFNTVQPPPPGTPQGETIVPKEPNLSPKDKGTTELDDSGGLQPTILFPMDD
jgi:hypothetical protein